MSDVPLNTDMDATRWAREFNDALQTVYPGVAPDRLDEDWLRAWFANAIMCGHDNARWEYTCSTSGGSVKPLQPEEGWRETNECPGDFSQLSRGQTKAYAWHRGVWWECELPQLPQSSPQHDHEGGK